MAATPLSLEVDDSGARHGSEKINPRLPCNAGQAGKNEDRLADHDGNQYGNFLALLQTRVGGRATWVDDAVVRGVGRLGGVWGHR